MRRMCRVAATRFTEVGRRGAGKPPLPPRERKGTWKWMYVDAADTAFVPRSVLDAPTMRAATRAASGEAALGGGGGAGQRLGAADGRAPASAPHTH